MFVAERGIYTTLYASIFSPRDIYTNVTLKYSCQLSSLVLHSLLYGSADWPKEQKANESLKASKGIRADSTTTELRQKNRGNERRGLSSTGCSMLCPSM